jgi:membrane protein implicated in regulation of membrane protease activity
MRIYREKGELVVEFRDTTRYYPMNKPFWINRVSDLCFGLDVLLIFLFIWPQLQANASSGSGLVVWDIQLPIGIWALLIGFLLSSVALRWLLAPHVRQVLHDEAIQLVSIRKMREMKDEPKRRRFLLERKEQS